MEQSTLAFQNAALLQEKMQQGGVFLTVKDGEKENIMVIGWGFVGTMWGKPVLVVPVRKSRYTYELLKKSGEFVVGVPKTPMPEALRLCGTKSGRDTDKIKETGFTYKAAKAVKVPVICECGLTYECRVLTSLEMSPDAFLNEEIGKWYPGEADLHTYFYGEILACYEG